MGFKFWYKNGQKIFPILDFFFLMWALLKVFIEFVTISLVLRFFFVFFLARRLKCGILAPQPGIKPPPEGKALTTGPAGKYLDKRFLRKHFQCK